MAGKSPISVQARLAEIDRRYRRKKGLHVSLAALRIRDLRALFQARYGSRFPDDDAGRDDLRLMAHHLAALSGNPHRRIATFVSEWAPWLSVAELDDLQLDIIKPKRWRADPLAWRLHLTAADRSALKITTIGAIDAGKAARLKRRRERARQRKEQQRRAQGAKPRAEYLANVKRDKPWQALGISRATYFRRRRATP